MTEALVNLDNLDFPFGLRRGEQEPSERRPYDRQLKILFGQAKAIRAELAELKQQWAEFRRSLQRPRRGRGRPRGSGHNRAEVYADVMQAQMEQGSKNKGVKFVARSRRITRRHVWRLIEVDRDLLAAFIVAASESWRLGLFGLKSDLFQKKNNS